MPRARPSLLLLLVAAAASLAGCAAYEPRSGLGARASVVVEAPEPWRQAASPEDERLVDALEATWARLAALTDVRRGDARLPDPRAALLRAPPPPGAYLCRFVPLGAAPPAGRRAGFCYVGVEKDRLSLTVEAGPERLGGYLFESRTSARFVFLGAAASHRGGTLRGYGEDPGADVAGAFERIGPFRYRLAVPSRDGAWIGLYELVPAPAQ